MYDKTEGADNSDADFDADGNFLISKVTGQDDEGHDVVEKVISNRITSLNEYFQHIEDLASLAIGNGRSGSDPYFLRLPLNEPFFEINANTRVIAVPATLRQIGVVGDKYAEVVFFKIDRYYDAIDLDTRQIYIEWEDAAGNKGVSRDFLRDTQSEKNKIIFGWVIGDELTKNVGTIRFAVRFVEWNYTAGENEDQAVSGTELAYSFSSLPAQITIVDSLHYDLFEDSEQAKMINTDGQAGTILFFLKNSDPDSADETTVNDKAAAPVFLEGRNLVDKHDLENGSLRLQVEAVPKERSGTISYMFGRKAKLEGEGSGTTGIVAKIDFIKVEDLNAIDSRTTLYAKKSNDSFEVIARRDIEEGDEVYEKVAYMIAAGPGYYFANARNTEFGYKTNSAISNILYIPYAEEPTVTVAMPERFVIKENNWKVVRDETIDQSKRENKDISNLAIVPVNEQAGPATIVLGAEVGPKFNAEKTKGLTYTWYKNGEAIPGVTGETLEVSEPGIYEVSVDNFYNNDHKAAGKEKAGAIRVTNMPTIPAIAWEKWENIINTGAVEDIEVSEVEHDEISFEWHR